MDRAEEVREELQELVDRNETLEKRMDEGENLAEEQEELFIQMAPLVSEGVEICVSRAGETEAEAMINSVVEGEEVVSGETADNLEACVPLAKLLGEQKQYWYGTDVTPYW